MKYKIVCAWCGKVLQDGDNERLVSHGICEDCEKKLDETHKQTDAG